MEVPRGFTRCDECEGSGHCSSCADDYTHDCPVCSGSGLVPTEKLREEAREAVIESFRGSFGAIADAVLVKVSEHLIGENR